MKANKSQDHATVMEHIARVVMALNEKHQGIIDSDYVANVVESRIDIHQVSPHLTKYLAILQLKQDVRSYLRHTLDPVEVVTDKLASGQDDLFDDILQDHYPAKREIMGEVKEVYVLKELMTEKEVETVAGKMEKASDALARHAEALRAWYQTKV